MQKEDYLFNAKHAFTAKVIENFYCRLSFFNPQQYTQTYQKNIAVLDLTFA